MKSQRDKYYRTLLDMCALYRDTRKETRTHRAAFTFCINYYADLNKKGLHSIADDWFGGNTSTAQSAMTGRLPHDSDSIITVIERVTSSQLKRFKG